MVYPDNTSVATVYYPTGDTALTYGSRQYPARLRVRRSRPDDDDDQLDHVTERRGARHHPGITMRIVAGWTASAILTATGRIILIPPVAGWSTAQSGPGRERAGERILTTYKYGFQDGTGTNGVGDLIGVAYTYNPGQHPFVELMFMTASAGELPASQGGMTTTLSYNDASDFLGESYSGGVLDGFSVSSGYNSIDRRTSLTASGQFGAARQHLRL